MRTFLRVVLAFLAGLIVTYVVVVAAAFGYMEASHVFDRDGGMAMGIIFIIGPFAGIVGGTVCAIVVPIRLARRDLRRAAGELPPAKPWPQSRRVAVAIMLTGIPVYLLGRFVLWLYEGMSFKSYWTALAVGYAPLIAAIAAAALAALLVSRSAKPQS